MTLVGRPKSLNCSLLEYKFKLKSCKYFSKIIHTVNIFKNFFRKDEFSKNIYFIDSFIVYTPNVYIHVLLYKINVY